MRPIKPDSGPIVIFDSGIGGLPYLSEARCAMPAESFVYAADRAGFPYGTKSREELRSQILDLVARLVRSCSPKALVIACNTASQAALEAVRRANPGLPVVGTVPAVKPAAELSRGGVIGIMATAGAVEDPYLDALVARHGRGLSVLREGAQDLVTFVERRSILAGEEERQAAVAPYVRRLVEGGADVIVLACTHFLHLRDDIAAVAGPSVQVVDSRSGVVRRLKALLGERGLLNVKGSADSEGGESLGLFILTGDEPFEPEYALLARKFGLGQPCALAGTSHAWTD